MTYAQAVLLGLVQGLGEFLPISSSAHLIITPWLFGFPDPGLTFDVALHFGTLFALVAYFWRDWFDILSGAFKALFKKSSSKSFLENYELKLLVFLALASVPAAIAGVLLEKFAESTLRNPLIIAFDMIFLGLFLFWADRGDQGPTDLKGMTLKKSLAIGFSQALALAPGVSRSGVTMTTGLFLGLNRVTAARFSFLLAAPITFGACLMKAKHFIQGGVDGPAIVGILVSALSGFLSIKYLLKYVQFKNYRPFVYYRVVFSIMVVVVYFLRS